MSLQLKRKFKENLDSIPVYIEDTSLTSEGYFGIAEFPKFFGRGKNGVRVKPNRVTLRPGSQLYVEILDVNRQSVYYEIPDYNPGDLSRYISVWVYGERDDSYNTPNGVGEIIICGIADRTENGEEIPNEFKNVINVRWRRKITISRDARSESPIVFLQSTQPTLSVSESLSFFTNTSATRTTQSINETIVYSSDFGGENVFLETPSSFIEPEWLNSGIIKFNLQNVTLTPTITSAESAAELLAPVRYTASLQSLVTSRKVRVANPLTASVTTKFQSILKTFTGFSTGSFDVEYIDAGDAASTIPISFAHITIDNINPIIGNIDKINVYAKSLSTNVSNTQYRLIGTKILNEPISSSITDIYYNTVNNLTSSKFTFPFPALKQNDVTDIKVEFVNVLNDTSELILNKQLNFVGYNPGGSSVTYVSGSNPTINSIRIVDNDPDVSVNFNDNTGRLTLIFGFEENMKDPNITLNPSWNSNRFNNETQTYTVTGNFPESILGSYLYVVTASLFTGSVGLVSSSAQTIRSISTTPLTTSGSQSYRLQVTASKDPIFLTADNVQDKNVIKNFTISKLEPNGPVLYTGPSGPGAIPITTIQNNYRQVYVSDKTVAIEQHATGSVTFTYVTSSNSNGWEYIPNSLTASINGGNPNTSIVYKDNIYETPQTLIWTGSMTGSSNVTLQANAHYRSPGTSNIPQIFSRPQSDIWRFQKIKSIRYGIIQTSSTLAVASLLSVYPNIITDLGFWSLSPTRSIDFQTTTLNNTKYTFEGGFGHAVLVCGIGFKLSGVINTAGVSVDTFSQTPTTTTNDNFITSGGYKIYLSRGVLDVRGNNRTEMFFTTTNDNSSYIPF
jgi:hypothetical protein